MFGKMIHILNDIFRFILIYMPGGVGIKLRYLYYKGRFKHFGKNVIIDVGVTIENPAHISIGDNVWIDKYSILLAGPINLNNCILRKKENIFYKEKLGELIIGNETHIGIQNIIQAYGGVKIGNYVTTSPGVKIYSLSNTPFDKERPEVITYANCLVKNKPVSYIISPIVIENGVWIALNSIILKGKIGENSFISTNSVVVSNISDNSYVAGSPGKRIKDRFRLVKE